LVVLVKPLVLAFFVSASFGTGIKLLFLLGMFGESITGGRAITGGNSAVLLVKLFLVPFFVLGSFGSGNWSAFCVGIFGNSLTGGKVNTGGNEKVNGGIVAGLVGTADGAWFGTSGAFAVGGFFDTVGVLVLLPFLEVMEVSATGASEEGSTLGLLGTGEGTSDGAWSGDTVAFALFGFGDVVDPPLPLFLEALTFDISEDFALGLLGTSEGKSDGVWSGDTVAFALFGFGNVGDPPLPLFLVAAGATEDFALGPVGTSEGKSDGVWSGDTVAFALFGFGDVGDLDLLLFLEALDAGMSVSSEVGDDFELGLLEPSDGTLEEACLIDDVGWAVGGEVTSGAGDFTDLPVA
jgi:hypothetical protein